MTEREQAILKAILSALRDMDGGQLAEVVLNTAVDLKVSPKTTLAEFERVLGIADSQKLVIGIRNDVTKKVRWSISSKGEAFLTEL